MEIRILREFILRSVGEDLGDGDHSSLACIPWEAVGKAELLIKEEGILAGVDVAKEVFSTIDSELRCDTFIKDASKIKPGDIVLNIYGRQQSILKSERLVLNIMQRMSGIATSTNQYVERLSGLKTKILDTRKTTPGFRFLEKEAVRIGGGLNHRMGLFDMIMLKDNHIFYAGGVENAIRKTNEYLRRNNRKLKIEIEARNLDDVRRILATGGINRIMLDNFSTEDTRSAVKMIDGRYETESSGGITLDTVRSYAECGVDFISVGALTHHLKSLDMSLNAV
ncbi:MAG TPA: carboxylating nicotinate-nucleotide diphosphorylase [Bacteroidales bacterium]|jgi:nicotinate-nucleotide pyrophosphorylase (carboxylating)|nr:carboxylating nicotinate-nucleotide diphosphorylase [Bacteroidales bacterium]OQB62789.1 MAG: putative nicotinate-nucleotide pyrophosphorylase (carboxylating) [Bacteroidetes bacterium ADurb.Bin145]HOU01947.1 carboxylating nicotinate-nucleotide diphosphorylase [Bacteroidales bacterium]HQG62127.1 carboxylating nicotinate-nucleotide diphosphorylase [Bacteroidales bacterium]HQK67768.1 carboxylating nicotinate-nucleotide diphosphorylase [Bacteroidales bacterium]